MWYHRPRRIWSSLFWSVCRVIFYVGGRYRDKAIDRSADIAIAAFVLWAGWTFAVPEEKKQEVRTVVSIEGLRELTAAIRDIREWAAIEIERQRE